MVGYISGGAFWRSFIEVTNNGYRCVGQTYTYYTWEYSYYVSYNRYSAALSPASANIASGLSALVTVTDMS